MNITEMFVAINIALGSGNPVPLEDVYSARESDGQRFYYAAADEEYGKDKENPTLINGNDYQVNFEVSVTREAIPIEIAQSEIQDYQGSDGDTYQLVSPLLKGKNASQALALYSSAGLDRVLLPFQFSASSGSWVEFFRYEPNEQAVVTMIYKEINSGELLEVIAIARHDRYLVEDVFSHWQSLIGQYASNPKKR